MDGRKWPPALPLPPNPCPGLPGGQKKRRKSGVGGQSCTCMEGMRVVRGRAKCPTPSSLPPPLLPLPTGGWLVHWRRRRRRPVVRRCWSQCSAWRRRRRIARRWAFFYLLPSFLFPQRAFPPKSVFVSASSALPPSVVPASRRPLRSKGTSGSGDGAGGTEREYYRTLWRRGRRVLTQLGRRRRRRRQQRLET